MDAEDYLQTMIGRLMCVLEQKEEQLRCFKELGVQVEGWFKGELLYFLEKEKKAGRISRFDREVTVAVDKGNKKVDFKIELGEGSKSVEIWMELKHWLIGKQKGTSYNAGFYFEDKYVGLKADVEKLKQISSGSRYILVLATGNPRANDWSKGVEKFNKKFEPLALKSLTEPRYFPDFYYIGLLKVL